MIIICRPVYHGKAELIMSVNCNHDSLEEVVNANTVIVKCDKIPQRQR